MAAAVGKYAANKFLKKQMKGYQNKKVESDQDPYFAMIEDPRRPGKLKKVKKQIPAYIPEHDAMILASVRHRAYKLDMCLFSLFGIRFGWEAVIGLVPMIGDVIGVLFALMIVRKAMKVEGGLPSSVQAHMMVNIAIDFAVGLVPFIGDLADAAYKCNTKNLRVLEVHLDKKHKPKTSDNTNRAQAGDKQRIAANRQSGIYLRHDPPPATVFEDFSDEEEERRNDQVLPQHKDPVQQPKPTKAKGQGFFSSRR